MSSSEIIDEVCSKYGISKTIMRPNIKAASMARREIAYRLKQSGMSNAEIAKLMDVTPDMVRSYIHKYLAHALEQLE